MKTNKEVQEPTPMNRTTDILKTISDGIKILAASVVILYGIGFVVVNSYLQQYGIASFELLKARYIAAGVNWLFFTLIIVVSLTLAAFTAKWVFVRVEYEIETHSPKVKAYPLKTLFLYVKFLCAGLVCLMVFAWTGFIVLFGIDGMLVLVVGKCYTILRDWFLAIVVAAVVVSLMTVRLTRTAPGARKFWPYYYLPYLVPISVALWLGAVVYFGINVYPKWPANLGGGRPIKAKFVLSPQANPHLGVLPLDSLINKDGFAITEQLQLIDQTSRSYVVIVKDGSDEQVVEIRKDLVDQVVYQKPGAGVSHTNNPAVGSTTSLDSLKK